MTNFRQAKLPVMKTTLLLLLLVVFSVSSQATVHLVQVADFSFTPANVNALCGDTILWTWVSGMHTTTSFNIPACANGWNAQVNSTSPVFSWVVSCGGTYLYECTMHPSMIGTITVGCATGITNQTLSDAGAFPNPFRDHLAIKPGNNDYLQITDLPGRSILDLALQPGEEKKLPGLAFPQGIYVLRFYTNGLLTHCQKLVRQ